MARKAACFFRCLEALQMTRVETVVTSDRILDHDLGWVKGKTVALVDEALISGTTLYFAKKLLLAAGALKVTTHVLLVNTDWWSPELVKPEPGYLRLSDPESAAVSEAIVSAMSLLPRPYSVDFPLLKRCRIRDAELTIFQSTPGWSCYDVTTSLQREHGVVTITMEPDAKRLASILEAFGLSETDVSIAKVRIYGRRTPRGRSFNFRALTYFIFNPITDQFVTTLFGEVLRNVAPESGAPLRDSCTTGRSKLRLLQYLFASKLAGVWLDTLNPFFSRSLEPSHDDRELCLLFPPLLSPPIKTLTQELKGIRLSGTPYAKTEGTPSRIKFRSARANIFDIQYRLTKPFVDMYVNRELKARQLVKKYGEAAFDKDEYRIVLNRLNTGVSIPQLENVIPVAKNLDRKRVLSAFLDFAVDRGIVVPITTEEKSDTGVLFYRAYRHGEEIVVTQKEIRVLAVMFRDFFAEFGNTGVSKLWIEKTLALFIKAGARSNVFTEWHGQLGAPGTVGIRYFLHGAIVQQGTRRLTDYRQDASFAQYLVDEGVLENQGGAVRLARIPETPVDQRKEDHASVIAMTFGRALRELRKGKSQHESDRILTMLASCYRPQEALVALAAELRIFSEYWNSNRNRIHSALTTRMQPPNFETYRSAAGYVAIHSGLFKYEEYEKGTPGKVVEAIYGALLAKKGAMDAKLWRQLWPREDTFGPTTQLEHVGRNIQEAGLLLHKISLLMRFWEFICRKERGQPEATQLVSDIEGSLAELHLRVKQPKLHRIWSEISSVDHPGIVIDDVVLALDSQVVLAEGVLGFVDEVIQSHGRLPAIKFFPHALRIRVSSHTRNESYFSDLEARLHTEFEPILSRIKHSSVPQGYRQDQRKASSGLDLNSDEHLLVLVPITGAEKGIDIVLCGRGNRSPLWLTHLAAKTISLIGPDATTTAHLLLDLPEQRQLYFVEGSSQLKNEHFWDLANAISTELPEEALTKLVIIAPPQSKFTQGITKYFREFFGGGTGLRDGRHKEFSTEVPYVAFITDITVDTRKTVTVNPKLVDVAVISIVADEVRSLKGWLSRHGPVAEVEGISSDRLFLISEVPGLDGTISVVATQALRQGNRSIVSAVEDVFRNWHPRIVLLAGIGARLSPKTEIGDVVVATGAHYADDRVEEEGKATQRRLESFRLNAWSETRVSAFFNTYGDPAIIGTFKAVPGEIASSEILLRAENHSIREYLSEISDKIIAVDKEIAGFFSAFHERELVKQRPEDGYFVFRGISDSGDKLKADGPERQRATDNTFMAVESFLKNLRFKAQVRNR